MLWDHNSDLPVVRTDTGKLRQILRNLIDNAIKFTERGQVTVSARVLNDVTPPARSRSAGADKPGQKWVEFKIVDTGIGIQLEALPTIFGMFRQVDSSQTRSYGGVGMGLYIVQKLTDLLGGSIAVESELGKGSTFTVTIPIGNRLRSSGHSQEHAA